MTNATPARYQLFAVTTVGAASGPVGWRYRGDYADLESAIRARVEDVLAQLASNDGWLINAEHLILGPGHDGPATRHTYVTELGADPASDRVPNPHNEPAMRRWLLAAHALSC